jgi:hypothetical protein
LTGRTLSTDPSSSTGTGTVREEKRRRRRRREEEDLLNKFLKKSEKSYAQNYYHNHKAVMDARSKHAVLQYIDLLELLGSHCVRCGFADIRALQIDHINGQGKKEFQKFKGNISLYRFYLKNPDLAKKYLQVLCANCNWIKRFENKEVGLRIPINIVINNQS